MNVTVYPNGQDEEVVVENVVRLSLIDAESHGPSRSFGIDDSFSGRAVWVCAPNVDVVVVDA